MYFDAENGQLTKNHCADSIWRTELILKSFLGYNSAPNCPIKVNFGSRKHNRTQEGYGSHHLPPVNTCHMSPTKTVFDDLSIKTRRCCLSSTCHRRMGVADLSNACSDWSTVSSVGLQFYEVLPTMSVANVADVFLV